MRTKAKRDATEAAIVAALEQIGCTVVRVSSPGFPDLAVSHEPTLGYTVLLVEVKSPSGRATKAQVDCKLPYMVVRDVAGATALFGVCSR